MTSSSASAASDVRLASHAQRVVTALYLNCGYAVVMGLVGLPVGLQAGMHILFAGLMHVAYAGLVWWAASRVHSATSQAFSIALGIGSIPAAVALYLTWEIVEASDDPLEFFGPALLLLMAGLIIVPATQGLLLARAKRSSPREGFG